MDPAQAIADYLITPKRHTRIRRDLLDAVKGWYQCGGFHPSLESIRHILQRMQGDILPNGWADDARTLGAR
jgi:hypothetical protein